MWIRSTAHLRTVVTISCMRFVKCTIPPLNNVREHGSCFFKRLHRISSSYNNVYTSYEYCTTFNIVIINNAFRRHDGVRKRDRISRDGKPQLYYIIEFFFFFSIFSFENKNRNSYCSCGRSVRVFVFNFFFFSFFFSSRCSRVLTSSARVLIVCYATRALYTPCIITYGIVKALLHKVLRTPDFIFSFSLRVYTHSNIFRTTLCITR